MSKKIVERDGDQVVLTLPDKKGRTNVVELPLEHAVKLATMMLKCAGCEVTFGEERIVAVLPPAPEQKPSLQ